MKPKAADAGKGNTKRATTSILSQRGGAEKAKPAAGPRLTADEMDLFSLLKEHKQES